MVIKNYRWDGGAWRVYKWIDGKCYYFGRYEDETQAIKKVNRLRKNNWDGLLKPKKRKTLFPFEEDEELINRIAIERNIKYKTKATYCQSVIHYTEYLKQSFTSLIEVYYAEEETTPWKKRTLKKHLIGFRNYLYNNYLKGTAKNYFSRLLTLFRHLEIELNYLPMLNTKNIKEPQPITHSDLLTKEELEKCYNVASPLMKAIILFQTSTGCARRETLNLTVKDYLIANEVNIIDKPVKSLLLQVNQDNIPCFKLKRQKTNKYYFTYCTPQANIEILEYLINREHLSMDSPVFDMNLYYWNNEYASINNTLNLGTAANYNRFRSHMLRKYHASMLYNHGMNIDDIDSLQGRSKDSTHQSYFMEDPLLLKKKYIEHMDCLLLEV